MTGFRPAATPAPAAAEVFVDEQLPAGTERPLVEALAALGLSPRVRAVPPRRGLADWLVLVVLPLHAFLSAVGGRVADDVYRQVCTAMRALVRHKGPPDAPDAPDRPMVLRDAATGLEIVLYPDLPAEGYRQLFALDLSQFRRGPVRYDHRQRRWLSDLDEAGPRP